LNDVGVRGQDEEGHDPEAEATPEQVLENLATEDFLGNNYDKTVQEVVSRWMLNDEGNLEQKIKNEQEMPEYHHVPDITALADRLRSYLQDSDELPKDFTMLFNENSCKVDADLTPEFLDLYKIPGMKHEPLTLIPPVLEAPVPATTLDLYDLDEKLPSENVKMAHLTNKGTDDDVEFCIKERGAMNSNLTTNRGLLTGADHLSAREVVPGKGDEVRKNPKSTLSGLGESEKIVHLHSRRQPSLEQIERNENLKYEMNKLHFTLLMYSCGKFLKR